MDAVGMRPAVGEEGIEGRVGVEVEGRAAGNEEVGVRSGVGGESRRGGKGREGREGER